MLTRGQIGADFFDPPTTVISEIDEAGGEAVADLYMGLPGPVLPRAAGRVAEMIKYADNIHALEVGFANEISAV